MRRLIINLKIVLPVIIFMVFSGPRSSAQELVCPVVAARFANPFFDCAKQTYCVDVELWSDTPDQQIYGINVRFFFDGTILKYLSTGDFAEGYDQLDEPQITDGDSGSGAYFGLNDPLKRYNGAIQLDGVTSLYISTTQEWTKYFSVCFKIINPGFLNIDQFCPSLVWDLQVDPESGGYVHANDGLVITLVGEPESIPTREYVDQFNWEYAQNGNVFGTPEPEVCVSTVCDFAIPLANWAIFLAIGLMIMASVFIYRRRA